MTSEEISGREFSSSLRGLNPEEVYEHLDTLAQEWRLMEEKQAQMASRLRELKGQLERYQEREQTLKKALETLEENRIQVVEAANREATLIRGEASLQAEKILKQAEGKRELLAEEIRTLEILYARLRSRLKVTLETFFELLKTPEELREELLPRSLRQDAVEEREEKGEEG